MCMCVCIHMDVSISWLSISCVSLEQDPSSLGSILGPLIFGTTIPVGSLMSGPTDSLVVVIFATLLLRHGDSMRIVEITCGPKTARPRAKVCALQHRNQPSHVAHSAPTLVRFLSF